MLFISYKTTGKPEEISTHLVFSVHGICNYPEKGNNQESILCRKTGETAIQEGKK